MDRPIGYWLRHLHNLIETQFDATLADLGVSRRHWQTLNVLSRGPAARAAIDAALAPFWEHGEVALDEVLDDLTARGWIDDTIALTAAGRAAHADIANRVHRTRGDLLAGLTPDQYAETIRVLSVMAGNVEAALAAR